MTIIHLTEYILRYDEDQDPETTAPYTDPTIITHLTKEKWFIVLADEGPQNTSNNFTDSHFDSKNRKRINLYADADIWMVPRGTLVAPCFCYI